MNLKLYHFSRTGQDAIVVIFLQLPYPIYNTVHFRGSEKINATNFAPNFYSYSRRGLGSILEYAP